jgi:hypothetical protein
VLSACLLVLLCRDRVELNKFIVVFLASILRLMSIIHVVFDCLIKWFSILVFKDHVYVRECVCVHVCVFYPPLVLWFAAFNQMLELSRSISHMVCIYITMCASFSCSVTVTQSRYILLDLSSSSFCSLILWPRL